MLNAHGCVVCSRFEAGFSETNAVKTAPDRALARQFGVIAKACGIPLQCTTVAAGAAGVTSV